MNTSTESAEHRIGEIQMSTPSLTGAGIAKVLRGEGFSADQTESALLAKGYTVQRECAPWGIILHISFKPVVRVRQALAGLMGASSEAAWHQKPA